MHGLGMRTSAVAVLLLAALLAAGPAVAQEPVETVDAEEAGAASEDLATQAAVAAALAEAAEAEAAAAAAKAAAVAAALDALPKAEESIGSGRSIQEEISVDLIDLTALRRAAESQPGRETVRMSLAEAVQLALRQNPDILVTSFEPLKSEADIYSARGEFDPMLQGQMNYTRSDASANQQIQLFGQVTSVESWNTNVVGSVLGKLKTGTQYAVTFNSNKEESTFGGFIEEFGSQLSLTLTQPVLRGFGTKYNTVRIQAAKNARALTGAQLRLSVLRAVNDVVRSYWDLTGATEAIRVSEDALKNAERLLKINETRREIGTAADIEVLQTKAGVAMRQSELIAATSRARDAADLLKQALGMRDGEFFSKAMIIPTDRPNPVDTSSFDYAAFEEGVDRSVKLALEKRPEMAMSDIELQNAQLDEYRTRHEMLPQVDLTASYAQGGRDHKLSRSLYGIRDKQDEIYSVGIQGTVPINNRAARGQHLRAQLTRRQAEERRRQTELGLMTAVHVASRNMMTSKILMESNAQAVRLQEANVVAEEKRLRLGVTTSFQVLRIQEDLTAARIQELQSRIAYEKALLELQTAEGTLLENLGVDVIQPGAEEPVPYFESIRPRWE